MLRGGARLVLGGLAVAVGLTLANQVRAQSADQFRTTTGIELELPITRMRLDAALERIAEQRRAPFGVELVGARHPDAQPGSHVLNLAGLSLEEVFDLLARYGARYEMARHGAVIVARPHGASSDTNSVLNRTIQEFVLDAAPVDDALFHLMFAIDSRFRPPSRRPSASQMRQRLPDRARQIERALEKRITLRLSTPTVLTVLNAIVEQHGGIWWRVNREPGAASFELRGFDGWGFGVDLRPR